MPGESYKLALTPELARQIFVESGKLAEPELNGVLAGEGKYVNSEGDANWWIPSGRIFYSPGSDDTPVQELAHARAHFFLPHRFRDPFHSSQVSTETIVTYDDHKLLVAKMQDAVGNTITALNDYRVLQPRLVTDPNRNRTEVAFDTLGMVAGTAVKGKDGSVGDTLSEFQPDLTASSDRWVLRCRGSPRACAGAARERNDAHRLRPRPVPSHPAGAAGRSDAMAARLRRRPGA